MKLPDTIEGLIKAQNLTAKEIAYDLAIRIRLK